MRRLLPLIYLFSVITVIPVNAGGAPDPCGPPKVKPPVKKAAPKPPLKPSCVAWKLGGTLFLLPAQANYGTEIGASLGPAKHLKSGWVLSPQLLVVHNSEGDGGLVSSKSGHHVYPYPGPQSDTRAGLLFSWVKD